MGHNALTAVVSLSVCLSVSEMTYTVSSGTLNPSTPYHTLRLSVSERLNKNKTLEAEYFTSSSPPVITRASLNFFTVILCAVRMSLLVPLEILHDDDNHGTGQSEQSFCNHYVPGTQKNLDRAH